METRLKKLLAHQIQGPHTKTPIPFLIHPTTKTKVFDPQAIADVFSSYYSTLYNLKDDLNMEHPDTAAIQSFLSSVHLPCLSQDQLNNLNTPFTTLEVGKAIDSLPKNKAPGPDGFVGEYYQNFKSILL